MRTQKKIKLMIGTVIGDAMDKTIRVETRSKRKHPVYMKYVPIRTVVLAHDEKEQAKPGDKVELSFTRRISKRKTWKLNRVLMAAETGAAR